MVTGLRFVAVAAIVVQTFATSEGPMLPEPDLPDGYSLSVTKQNRKAAYDALDPAENRPRREIRKAWLILRLPHYAGHRQNDDEAADSLPEVAANARLAKADRIKTISEALQRTTFEPASFQENIRSNLGFKDVQTYNREDYSQISTVPHSITVWLPGQKSDDGLEILVLANVLDTFGGIAPIIIIFGEVKAKFEIRVPQDAQRFSTTVFGSVILRQSFGGDHPDPDGTLSAIWGAILGHPRSRAVGSPPN